MKIKQESLEQYDYVDGEYIEKVKKRYAHRIGLFMIRFSELEHTLDTALAEHFMDDAHEMGYLVIEGLSVNNKIELFRKLCQQFARLLAPKKLPRLKRLIKRLHDLRVFRNYLAHANWSSLDKTGYVRTRIDEKDGEIVLKKVRMTPDKIETWIRRIDVATEDLDDFKDTLHDDV